MWKDPDPQAVEQVVQQYTKEYTTISELKKNFKAAFVLVSVWF